MKYKGFVIKAVYETDYRPTKYNNEWESYKTKDILYYEILDPMDGGDVWIKTDTKIEAKSVIDNFLLSCSMKDNKVSSWSKLSGYNPTHFNIVDINELDSN